jgi:hypothetical protein
MRWVGRLKLKVSDMDKVEIFTDGACKGNPGPGGWGAWIIAGGWDVWESAGRPVSYEKELCGGRPKKVITCVREKEKESENGRSVGSVSPKKERNDENASNHLPCFLHVISFVFLLVWLPRCACYFIFRLFLKTIQEKHHKKHFYEWFSLPFVAVLVAGLQFLAMRGGWQQIPLNINSATYSNKAIANDLSINSFYFFGKSYLLYNRSSIDAFIPKVDKKLAQKEVAAWYNYPTEHENELFTIEKPNVVFIVLEGWSAEAVGCLGPNKGATPNFDRLAKDGLLFTNIYATSTTSEIGNSSIFSGNPAIPEVSVTMQPEKYRKLHSFSSKSDCSDLFMARVLYWI